MLEEAVRTEKKHFDSSDFRIGTSNMSTKKINKPRALEGKGNAKSKGSLAVSNIYIYYCQYLLPYNINYWKTNEGI